MKTKKTVFTAGIIIPVVLVGLTLVALILMNQAHAAIDLG